MMLVCALLCALQSWCFAGDLGVPQHGLMSSYYGQLFSQSVRIDTIKKAIALGDLKTVQAHLYVTDLIDYPDLLVAAVVGNNVAVLQVMDHVTYDAYGYHLDVRGAYHHDQLPKDDLLILAIDADAYDAIEYLLAHGYRRFVGKTISQIHKTPYQYVLYHAQEPLIDRFMEIQAQLDVRQIDSAATIARGFIQARCYDDGTTQKCQHARSFFRTYSASMYKHGIIDHELLLDMVHHAAADHTESVVLEELIEMMEEIGLLWDVADKHGNYPLHTAVNASNKKAVPVLITKGAIVDAVDRQGQTPEDAAQDTLKICGQKAQFADEQIYIDVACKNAQETLQAYQDAVARLAAKKDNPDKELYGN